MTPTAILQRPGMRFAPGDGLLRAQHLQVAYVTNDMDRAVQVMGERYGVGAFLRLDAPCHGGEMRVELAWAGGVMVELIQAWGPGTEFYMDRLPAGQFAIRHHHYGYLIADLAAWDALRREVDRLRMPIVFEGHPEGLLRFLYIEAPDLDHYLEYFLLEPDGVALFESAPVS